MSDQPELYRPSSPFLRLLLDEQVALTEDSVGEAHLAHLIRLTREEDPANRDWAVFLLANSERDSAAVRTALRWALQDELEAVRLEALVGIAQREPTFALPRVLELLQAEWVHDSTIEAAGYVADPSLLPALRALAPGDSMAGYCLEEALKSCASGVQPQWRDFDD